MKILKNETQFLNYARQQGFLPLQIDRRGLKTKAWGLGTNWSNDRQIKLDKWVKRFGPKSYPVMAVISDRATGKHFNYYNQEDLKDLAQTLAEIERPSLPRNVLAAWPMPVSTTQIRSKPNPKTVPKTADLVYPWGKAKTKPKNTTGLAAHKKVVQTESGAYELKESAGRLEMKGKQSALHPTVHK